MNLSEALKIINPEEKTLQSLQIKFRELSKTSGSLLNLHEAYGVLRSNLAWTQNEKESTKPKLSSQQRAIGNLDSAALIFVMTKPNDGSLRELYKIFMQSDIQKSDCYITFLTKDKYCDYRGFAKLTKEGITFSAEGLSCKKDLIEELKNIKNKVTLAVGEMPLKFLLNRSGITKWRGSILYSEEINCLTIPLLDPDTLLFPGATPLNKFLIQLDLIRAKQTYRQGFIPNDRKYITGLSYQSYISYLNELYNEGIEGALIAFDIEIYNEELSCISFATSQYEATCIPFVDYNGDYFNATQELSIMKEIAKILEDKRIKKLGQNLVFDSHFLLRKYGIMTVNCEDTMIAQQIILPEYPKGLDFITSVFTNHPYYKDEGKRYFAGGGWKQLWTYNCTDSLICQEAFPKQLAKLKKQHNEGTYKRQSKLIEPLAFMQEYGIRVDLETMHSRRIEYEDKIESLKEELNELAGKELNANSNKQLVEYFYGRTGKNLKAYKGKTGNASVDVNALKRLAKPTTQRPALKEASIILKLRKLMKVCSTYMNEEKVDADQRIRCSYNPVGTKYSRLSSSENIFGTGMNLQNWPHDVKDLLVADPGMIIYLIDLSQAENRIVAYIGNVTPMIKAFEQKLDVHSLTGSLISGLPYDEVKQQDKEDVCCALGGGTQTWRFWGKKGNHGLNYDLGYKNFAIAYEISEKDAFIIVDKYHKAYPGVRNNFHANVKSELRENRTLINLMGRRIVFLSPLTDKLFKEAYSYKPQSTVGDVINERGLEYIYYDQQQFKNVWLQTQTHDDVGFQIPLPPKVSWREHAEILTKIKKELEIPLKTDQGREFIIPADITMGFSYKKENGKDIKNVPENLTEFAELLKRNSEALGWEEKQGTGLRAI